MILLLLLFALPARCQQPIGAQGVQLRDGTWFTSLGIGQGWPLGAAKRSFRQPYVVSADIFYVPRSEYALGLQVDRLMFMKKGSTGETSVVTFVDRANAALGYEKTLLYALIGIGFSATSFTACSPSF